MKLANLDTSGGWRLAALLSDRWVDLNRAAQLSTAEGRPVTADARRAADRWMPADMAAWLAMGAEARLQAAVSALEAGELLCQQMTVEEAAGSGLCLALDTARLAPAVPEGASVFAVGLNFPSHVEEAGAAESKWPIIFSKPRSALERHNAVIPFPKASRRVDYEGEVAVVIGAKCRTVPAERALDFVAGYTVANDLSARDWQFRTSEMMIGKAFDGFCPMGPTLTTADEVPAPETLQLTTRVNGEVRQHASLSEMLFSVAHVVSYLSEAITLQPGDAILLGTPAGTGVTMQPRSWLQPGDEIAVEVSVLGTLLTSLGS